MASVGIEPCIYYICLGSCQKKRDACHAGYCQKCDKYYPRRKTKHINDKKTKLDKIKNKEWRG